MGKKFGYGELRSKNFTYKGEFENDKFNGKGELQYKN